MSTLHHTRTCRSNSDSIIDPCRQPPDHITSSTRFLTSERISSDAFECPRSGQTRRCCLVFDATVRSSLLSRTHHCQSIELSRRHILVSTRLDTSFHPSRMLQFARCLLLHAEFGQAKSPSSILLSMHPSSSIRSALDDRHFHQSCDIN